MKPDRPERCHRCDARPDESGHDPLTWAYEREPGGPGRWLCPRCARRHARDIEARLGPEWW